MVGSMFQLGHGVECCLLEHGQSGVRRFAFDSHEGGISLMPKRRLKRKRRRGGRKPALTDQQKKQIRKIAQTEIETAFRTMLGSIGVQRARR